MGVIPPQGVITPAEHQLFPRYGGYSEKLVGKALTKLFSPL